MNKTMFRKLGKMTPRKTNSEKLDDLIVEVSNITELLRGPGHEGMFKKVERHDKTIYKAEGATKLVMWGFPPVAIVAIVSLIISILS